MKPEKTTNATLPFLPGTAGIARLASSILILGGIWLAFLTPTAPIISLRPVNFAQEQTALRTGIRALSSENQRLAALSLADFASEKTRACLQTASLSPQTIANLLDASEARPGAAWLWRASPDDTRPSGRPLFFAPGDPALSGLDTRISTPCYIAAGEHILELRRQTFHDSDFTLGAGFSGPDIPPALFHPFRTVGSLLLMAGVLLHLLAGYPRHPKGAAHYHRWRMVASDLVTALILYGFYILPIFIAGGSQRVFATALPITLVLWPMAAMGAFLAIQTAAAATFSVRPIPEGLVLTHVAGTLILPFDAMEWTAPAAKTSPKWLVNLLFIASAFGRGPRGQALLLASAQTEGVALRLKNGNTLFIWTTDQMGTPALSNWKPVASHIAGSGLPEHKNLIKRTGFSSDVLVDEKGRNMMDRKAWLASFAGLGFLLALFALLSL